MKRISIRILDNGLRALNRLTAISGGAQAVAVKPSIHFTIPKNFTWVGFSRQQLIILFLVGGLLFSAFSTIYVRDVHRRLMGDLQTLQNERAQMHNRWSQLLLEQSAWTSQARIVQLAKQQYDMVMPKPYSIVILDA